ncbi:two-component system response regulator [Bradyrhizobium japonicum]|uniref:Two-component system response regulator n=1 Tax=Bradyrhizobium japonicum TaxID=375 RepID=A0A1Y2JVA5_BRAJP|nr:response regulator [Bradyrhizobium japonicum]OSJ34661.1 two-component system response regulator [Bradyrhizobium japonicum]
MIEIGSHHQRLPLASSAKLTVYVVDDDAAVLGSLRFLLETDGFAVRTFRNATALLNATNPPRADCYVIDYKMPDINGIELARRLRQSDVDTPVILITGYPDGHISARAAAAGIKDVILKPLLDESLAKCICHAIQDRRGH